MMLLLRSSTMWCSPVRGCQAGASFRSLTKLWKSYWRHRLVDASAKVLWMTFSLPMFKILCCMRSFFSDQIVPASGLFDYGKLTACKDTLSKYTHSSDPLMSLPWDDLTVSSQVATVTEYMELLRNHLSSAVYTPEHEYIWKFQREIRTKTSEKVGVTSPRTSSNEFVIQETKKVTYRRLDFCCSWFPEQCASWH